MGLKKINLLLVQIITLSLLVCVHQGCGSPKSPAVTSSSSTNSTTTSKYAPIAPNQLVLTAGSSKLINLSWADNSTDESGFKIERAVSISGPFAGGSGPGAFTLIATVAANISNYADTNLTAGTTYYYRVYAANSAGNSPATSVMSLQTPLAPSTSPSAPASLSVTVVAASVLSLNWVDTSNNEDSFYVERSSDNGVTFVLIAVISANSTTYQDINLLEQKNYIYRVKAFNSVGFSNVTANANGTTLAAGNKASYSYISANIIGPNCVYCHGPQLASRGINISSYNLLLSLVSAGNANGSTLVTITSSGKMPPGGPLSADQINSLRLWINAGAPNN